MRLQIHPIRTFRVGGLRFVRVGRLQVSWCLVSRKPRTMKCGCHVWQAYT